MIPILKLFSELGKTWICTPGFSKISIFYLIYEFELGKIGSIHSPRQIFQNRSLNLWMNWQKSCPNLSFSVENKMGS